MFGFNTAKRADRWEEPEGFESVFATQGFSTVSNISHSDGIVAGTRIATAMGWRPVEAMAAGDMVMTFDHGMRPVRAVHRSHLFAGRAKLPRSMMPLAVPEGALGNASPMLLLPEQNVLVESDLAEAVFGDPFALIPAAALEGYRGITRITPHQRIEIITLQFDEDEVIYANGTGMIHCASVHGTSISAMIDEVTGYVVLPMDMAQQIVAQMIEVDALG
ncbi:Hint domain-containing protein [Rhodobacter sp. JA431]|uniref:Hint domain-containing protein n=1 Tax=Rhodobacter sp. JA431 TaxID=570013 RepID=UPI000BD1F066|nr:Hint domain-containing protein [Rhodobacter sp. JA431]SOB92621.1 Hint domain-containing protein [Rhodobacter sp. JA431]